MLISGKYRTSVVTSIVSSGSQIGTRGSLRAGKAFLSFSDSLTKEEAAQLKEMIGVMMKKKLSQHKQTPAHCEVTLDMTLSSKLCLKNIALMIFLHDIEDSQYVSWDW